MNVSTAPAKTGGPLKTLPIPRAFQVVSGWPVMEKPCRGEEVGSLPVVGRVPVQLRIARCASASKGYAGLRVAAAQAPLNGEERRALIRPAGLKCLFRSRRIREDV